MHNISQSQDCQNYNFEINAEWQFVIEDAEVPSPLVITRLHRLKVEGSWVYVGTWRYGVVQIEMSICKAKPGDADNLEEWDHVEEVTLKVVSGKISIRGVVDAIPLFTVSLPITTFRVRAYYGGLDLDKIDEEDGNEYYRIIMWPDTYNPPAVLKKLPGIESQFPMGGTTNKLV